MSVSDVVFRCFKGLFIVLWLLIANSASRTRVPVHGGFFFASWSPMPSYSWMKDPIPDVNYDFTKTCWPPFSLLIYTISPHSMEKIKLEYFSRKIPSRNHLKKGYVFLRIFSSKMTCLSLAKLLCFNIYTYPLSVKCFGQYCVAETSGSNSPKCL